MHLFPGEQLNLFTFVIDEPVGVSDDDVNEKYVKGDVRIVTEQARYPLNSISAMIESRDYELNPEFQRRHRWDVAKKSRLIESFIMNVPIPPIFLYEDRFSHYEVMDGLQRMTTIHDFYKDRFPLEGLEEWRELNGRRYSTLPDQIRRGIDRRYLSSIILLQETAKTPEEALRLKQLVFERINSGGVKLEPQESRNAIYNGPLNKLCIELARNTYLCRMWSIPEPSQEELATSTPAPEVLENESYRKMDDVELVLRFFAYRQRLTNHRGALKDYLDQFLKRGNFFEPSVLQSFRVLFEGTIKLVYETLGEGAFWLYRRRKSSESGWVWFERPTTVLYDPIMYVFGQYIDRAAELTGRAVEIKESLRVLYQENFAKLEGRYTNLSNIAERNALFENFLRNVLASS